MNTVFISFKDIDKSSYKIDLDKVQYTCACRCDFYSCIKILYSEFQGFDILAKEYEYKIIKYHNSKLRDEDLEVFNFIVANYGDSK
tara:strand:+ start:370 stop:627 length:258 start_codon:yes stop_codon:yes gene_type:complete